VGRSTFELANFTLFLPKGHLKQLVLVQKVIFLPYPVPRVVSNSVRIVCIGFVRNVMKIFLQC